LKRSFLLIDVVNASGADTTFQATIRGKLRGLPAVRCLFVADETDKARLRYIEPGERLERRIDLGLDEVNDVVVLSQCWIGLVSAETVDDGNQPPPAGAAGAEVGARL
jgi:hypothetical protein